MDWSKSWTIYPCFPVNLCINFICVNHVEVNELLGMSLEDLPLNRSVLVSRDIGIEHVSHMCSSNEAFDVPKELETFFIWDGRERVVRKIVSDVRMERGVRVPHSIADHASVGRLVTNESRFQSDDLVSISSDV